MAKWDLNYSVFFKCHPDRQIISCISGRASYISHHLQVPQPHLQINPAMKKTVRRIERRVQQAQVLPHHRKSQRYHRRCRFSPSSGKTSHLLSLDPKTIAKVGFTIIKKKIFALYDICIVL